MLDIPSVLQVPIGLQVHAPFCVHGAKHGTSEQYVMCTHLHGMLDMPSLSPALNPFHVDVHSMLPVRSMQRAASISPSSSASCDTSTTNSALCTSRASCPDTNSSDGHKTHHAAHCTALDGACHCVRQTVQHKTKQNTYKHQPCCDKRELAHGIRHAASQ